jgi:hypothetical protein
MKPQMILAHAGLPSFHIGGIWGFVGLVLLILFVTLVVTDGSKGKDK